MKSFRISIAILCMILLLCSTALADDFTLRSDIHFGDTMETILQKETTLTRTSETSNSFSGTIAGYSGSTCDFAFDDEGKLISMTYEFDCTSRESTNSHYKTLYDSLVRKYRSPLGNTNGSCHLITGPAMSNMAVWVYLFGTFNGWSADYYDYDEWTVDCDDYHVKIDLVSFYYRNSDYEYTYEVNLSYKQYTDAEYQAALDEKKTEREAVDNDL